ncbi:MAG: CAP domain-containing protein [Proteobacteria bacterium]|nr:CAP domain-containing protein [Pseudomonadota bacterium]
MNNSPFFFLLVLLCSIYVHAKGKDYVDCGESKQAIDLAKMIKESQGQMRGHLTCNKALSTIAALKARKMAKYSRVDHNIENTTPNELLSENGFFLPASYSILGNQVEAVSGGKKSPAEMFSYFMTSPNHKAHLLGENSFFKTQHQIGVGYYSDINSDHVDYWVVYIASLKEPSENNNNLKNTFVAHMEKENKPAKQRFKKGDTLHWREFKW